ncbi:MAG: hypothetical protein QOG01_718 [Pseudonocardiales bacterium]|jgi:hypothetical protein|nr:hypothetical protein [Pseudonocardiales bacterium]
MGLQWVGFVGGVAVLAGTVASVVGTLVVPRGIDSRISRACERTVDAGYVLITKPVRSFERRDRILAWQAPVTLLLRLGVWMGLLVFGYALVLLPLVPGHAFHSIGEAGSSIFTLGYSPPSNTTSTIVDYVAAFTGLVVVGLQIGYLPTLYAAFNRRETEVTLLVSRAGVPAWGPEILVRTRWGIYDGDTRPVLNELFDRWERWSAEVAESHTTYLTLVRLRSPRPLSHWLTSILAVMDAAALHLSLAPDREPKIAARRCLRMGFTALRQIAATMRLPVDEDPNPDQPIAVSYEEFASAVEMLQSLDYPVQVSTEDAWPNFKGWRVNYEALAYALAYAVDAPPALWSGTRRWPSEPISPRRPVNRRASDARPRATPN